MDVCLCVCTCAYICMCAIACMYVCACMSMYVCMCMCMCMQVHMHACVCMHMHVYLCMCIIVCKYMCVHVRAFKMQQLSGPKSTFVNPLYLQSSMFTYNPYQPTIQRNRRAVGQIYKPKTLIWENKPIYIYHVHLQFSPFSLHLP